MGLDGRKYTFSDLLKLCGQLWIIDERVELLHVLKGRQMGNMMSLVKYKGNSHTLMEKKVRHYFDKSKLVILYMYMGIA